MHTTRLHYEDKYDTYMKYLNTYIDIETLKQIVANSKLKPKYTSWYFQHPELINVQILDTTAFKAFVAKNKPTISDSSNVYYQFSFPVYDTKKQYAIVDFGAGYTKNKIKGYYYLLKRINDKWTILYKYDDWDMGILSKN